MPNQSSDPVSSAETSPVYVCSSAQSIGPATSLVVKAGLMIVGLGLALWFGANGPRSHLLDPGAVNKSRSGLPQSQSGVALAGFSERVVSTGQEHASRLSSTDATGKLDLNRSTVDDLQRLPGIGPILAERIVQRRKQVGSFERIEDLMTVHGIGRARLARLADRVIVTPPASSSSMTGRQK